MCEKMPLHSAVKKDQVEVAKLLINNGANVNVKDVWGNTPLFYAIENRDTEMTKLLLTNGADIKDNPYLLCTAAGKGCLTIVDDLLKYGADVNMLDRSRFGEGITSLHSAVIKNQVDVAKLLINYGANVNVKNLCGNTPLVYAIENGNTEMTKLLLSNGADIKDNPNLLCTAAGKGCLTIVEDLLKYGADVNVNDSKGRTPMSYAIERRGTKMTKLLLSNGADIKDNPNLLCTAAGKGCLTIVEDLLKYGADVNVNDSKGRTPMSYAIERRGTKMTKLLLSNGADIKDNPNLLCTAAGKGCLTIVEDLLKYGADVNMLDRSRFGEGLTSLHSAVIKNQVDVAKLLINYGANVNVKDLCGNTPLVYAIENGNTEMTKLLLSNGADIKDNPNLLCTAAGKGCLTIVEDLLKYGADVNIIDKLGFGDSLTPLYSAVKKDQVEVAKLLINNGANVNVKDVRGNTPLFYAIENRDTEMTKLLLTNGADIKDNPYLLCTAAWNGSLTIVEDLLKYGADVNVNDSKGRTPMSYAIERRGTKMTKLLLFNGADIKDNPNLLCTAAGKGCLTIVDDLLKYGADVNMLDRSRFGEGITSLHSAVIKNQVDVAKLPR